MTRSDQVSEEWAKAEEKEMEGEGERERKRVSKGAWKKAGEEGLEAKEVELSFIWNVDLPAFMGKSRRFQRGAFFNLS